MTSRDKLRAALAHEPGPIPIDFGSNASVRLRTI